MDSKIIGGIVLIVLIVAGFYYVTSNSSSAFLPPRGQNLLAIQLTDPPQVPSGTSALVIAYSTIQVHSQGGWTNVSGSGNINLLSILNLSQTLGTGYVARNSTINMVRFSVKSASITVNGTTYNLTVPSGTVTAHVNGQGRVNQTSKVLIQLSPTVVTILTSNSTVFVLVPSVKAVVVGAAGNPSHMNAGDHDQINESEHEMLDEDKPNVSISGSSLIVAGNTTRLSLTVANNANQSVIIKHIGLMGNLSIKVNSTAINARIAAVSRILQQRLNNSSFCMHQNASTSANSAARIGEIEATDNVLVSLNSSECARISANTTARIQAQLLNMSARLSQQQTRFRFMVFLVASNGTVVVPSAEGQFEGAPGYVLGAHQSFRFTFNGPVLMAQNHLVIKPLAGSSYRLGVQGEEGLAAVVNVTATSG